MGLLSFEEARAMGILKETQSKRNKYGVAAPEDREADGIRFASKRERDRYLDLRRLEQLGEIEDLELQPVFQCVVNGQKICRYTADFRYRIGTEVVVEDVKGVATRDYKLRKRLVQALHGVVIVEV